MVWTSREGKHHKPTTMKTQALETELEKELAKRDYIRERQLARYLEGSATRRRTTTSNAEADRCNERIEWLRGEIRRLAFLD